MTDPGRPTLAIRAAVEKHYGDLKGQLSLSGAETAAVTEALTVYHFRLMRTTQDYLDDPPMLLSAHKALNDGLQDVLTDLLGLEKYAQVRAHCDRLTGHVGLRGQEEEAGE